MYYISYIFIVIYIYIVAAHIYIYIYYNICVRVSVLYSMFVCDVLLLILCGFAPETRLRHDVGGVLGTFPLANRTWLKNVTHTPQELDLSELEPKPSLRSSEQKGFGASSPA